jgi:hypothetical protein
MKILLSFVLTVCAFAQIERPQLGVMLDQHGGARPVLGALASATLGDPVLQGVLSMECSARGCLAKTNAAVVSTNGQSADAPRGPAIFGGAYVYFPESQQLGHWHDGILEVVSFIADGDVLALRPDGDGLDYAVSRAGATWIEHMSLMDNGTDNSLTAITSFPEAHAAMLLDGLTLLAVDDGVHLLRPDGTDTIVNIAGVQAFVPMGKGCVEFVTAQGMWAFDLKQGLFLLPGVNP